MKIKKIVANYAMILFSILMLIFLSQSYFYTELNRRVSNTTGYDFMTMSQTGYVQIELAKASVIIEFTMTLIFLIISVINLLAAIQIIKSEKLEKWLSGVSMILSLLIAIFCIVTFASIVNFCEETSKTIEGYKIYKLSSGWACTGNFIIALVNGFISMYPLSVSIKKPAKKQK